MTPERGTEPLEMPYPQYRCAVCATDLPPNEAHMTVTCATHRPEGSGVAFTVRPATAADRPDIELICDRAWGETEVDAFGITFDVLAGESIIAEASGEFAGLISLALHGGELAIVLLSVYPQFQGAGVGSALIEAAVDRARAKNVPALKVATTNDDVPALYIYQRQGFSIFDVACGAVVDHHGAAIPGFANIPVRDEIRLRRPVCRLPER